MATAVSRMFPVAAWFAQADDAQQIKAACEASALTHAHPRSKFACAWYALFAGRLLQGYNLQEAEEQTVAAMSPVIPDAEREHFAALLDGSWKMWERSQVHSGGYVMDTLHASLWCLQQHPDNYDEAVLAAINLGGDTDTTATVVGSLIGARLGGQAVNRNWLSQIPQAAKLCAIAERSPVAAFKSRPLNLPQIPPHYKQKVGSQPARFERGAVAGRRGFYTTVVGHCRKPRRQRQTAP